MKHSYPATVNMVPIVQDERIARANTLRRGKGGSFVEVCVCACECVCACVSVSVCVSVRQYRLLNVFLGCFRLRKRNVLSPIVVNISVYKGHMNQGFSEEAALATVVTERWYLAPGVQRVDIRQQGVKGTLFIP